MTSRDGWLKASQGQSNCLEVKRASWSDLLMFRESDDELNPGVYVSPERWLRFLEEIKQDKFEPEKLPGGALAIFVSDVPRGTSNRGVYTSEENWLSFCQGVKAGKFDSLANYPRQFA